MMPNGTLIFVNSLDSKAIDGLRCSFMRFLFAVAVLLVAVDGFAPVMAQGTREQADKRDVKRQEFLKRLPLESRCKAEVAGGVVKPDGAQKWSSGPFEVEAQDDFVVTIAQLHQIPRFDQETCEAQARALEYDDTKRTKEFEDGHLVCMRRVYNDKGRLPQVLACRVSALLTQPTHLRCKNLDPILDPDGIFVAPSLITVMTLPQAVMTKGVCQASDRY
jgi:hypothetical protein